MVFYNPFMAIIEMVILPLKSHVYHRLSSVLRCCLNHYNSHYYSLLPPRVYHSVSQFFVVEWDFTPFNIIQPQFINDPLHSLSINPQFMINDHVYHGINGHDSGTDLLEIPTMNKAYVSGLCLWDIPQKYGVQAREKMALPTSTSRSQFDAVERSWNSKS